MNVQKLNLHAELGFRVRTYVLTLNPNPPSYIHIFTTPPPSTAAVCIKGINKRVFKQDTVQVCEIGKTECIDMLLEWVISNVPV